MFNFVNAIITFVQDFFEGLFFSSSPEYQKKKQLKLCAAELKKLTPPLYRTDKTLLPAYPFMPPAPHRKERNMPANTVATVEFMADLLDMDTEELAAQLWKNSCAAFQLPE